MNTAFVARLASTGDIQASLEDARPSPDPPELPQCYAGDLKVPKNYTEAMRSNNAYLWEHSVAKEYYGLLDAGTFREIEQQPETFIKAKWLFDWKVDEYGWPMKTKARLVARGDKQRPGFDFVYGEVFSPTVSVSSVRLLAALACEMDLDIYAISILSRLLYVHHLEEDVFMRMPMGCGRLTGKIVKLIKSLYGLK